MLRTRVTIGSSPQIGRSTGVAQMSPVGRRGDPVRDLTCGGRLDNVIANLKARVGDSDQST